MRLKSVRIQEFRSIRDSNEFEIGDVTCLVGKNEAGKTAVLQALYRLNPIIPEQGKFSITEDYPRSDVEDYQQEVEAQKRKHANVVTATYELDKEERELIEGDFGQGVIIDGLVIIKKGYDNATNVDIGLNEEVAARALGGRIDLSDPLYEGIKDVKDLKGLLDFINRTAAAQQAAFKKAMEEAEKLTDPAEQAQVKDAASKQQESAASKHLRDHLAKILKDGFQRFVWNNYLAGRWPKFLYFDEYYQMEGQVNVPALKQRVAQGSLLDSDRPMLGLVDLARLNLDQLLSANDTQALLNKIEGASNHLSKQILKYWSQNKHILIRFDLRPGLPEDPVDMREGMNLWGFVHDTKHLATTRLGTRSRGFVWFFSFLAWFSQQRKSDQPLILLLDEPGLFLHASAQGDLLRYVEAELKPHHQVIYTTHSPFMIDPKDFSRVRIVRDRSMEQGQELLEEDGTKVFTDVLEADAGTLFPLQGALGYDIAQTLFIGPNCLIVEGVSDLLYLQSISDLVAANGGQPLSPEWTITPVGGIDKVPTFVSLLGSQGELKIATLIDLQSKDKQTVESLYKKKLLKKKCLHTFNMYTETDEADIEDMFEVGEYIKLINLSFKHDLGGEIRESDLTSRSPRIVVRLSEYFSRVPLKRGSFNHFRPASYLVRNLSAVPLSEKTLKRFESAFAALNALLR